MARIAIETGISPQDLLALDKEMLQAILDGFKDRSKEMQDASKRKGRA